MKFHKDGTSPKNGEVFVFGSNKAGVHGAGAALHAAKNFGALRGVGYGMVDKSFAIPTKDNNIQTMHLDEIKGYVDLFINFANKRQHLNFYITRIGCGLAGYTDSDIAPMFKGIGDNCSVVYEWKNLLEGKQ
jgi:hypothetical protein